MESVVSFLLFLFLLSSKPRVLRGLDPDQLCYARPLGMRFRSAGLGNRVCLLQHSGGAASVATSLGSTAVPRHRSGHRNFFDFLSLI